MKLNKQQVSALANKIYEQVKAKIIEDNNIIKNSEEFKKVYEDAKVEIAKHKEELNKFCTSPSIYVDEYKIANIIGKEFKSYCSLYGSIHLDITLSTIVCETNDIDELIRNIASKYI